LEQKMMENDPLKASNPTTFELVLKRMMHKLLH